jgi:hypothetical protein
MKECIICSCKLNPLNHAEYRKRNYINKCNDCVRHEKKVQGRARGKKENNNRSQKYRDALKTKDPVRYTCLQLSGSAQKRAKKFNMDFDIKTAFLISIAPEKCPVFGFDLIYGPGTKGKFAASIDRIDSTKGYTKNNVQIISYLANLMKSNASKSEMVLFSRWVLKKEKGVHKDSL